MFTEQEARKKVRILKHFYMDLLSYFFINIALILIWFVFDKSGTFWPKYVIVVWGIALIFKGYRMGVNSLFCEHISFLTPVWEEKKVKELMGKKPSQHKVPLKRDHKK